MFFGWERGHQLSTYSAVGGWWVIQNAYSCVQGEGVSKNKKFHNLQTFVKNLIGLNNDLTHLVKDI